MCVLIRTICQFEKHFICDRQVHISLICEHIQRVLIITKEMIYQYLHFTQVSLPHHISQFDERKILAKMYTKIFELR